MPSTSFQLDPSFVLVLPQFRLQLHFIAQPIRPFFQTTAMAIQPVFLVQVA